MDQARYDLAMNQPCANDESRPRHRVEKLRGLVSCIVLLLTGVSMAVMTWRHWPDVLIDSGREAYVPWRLSTGDVLYCDIESFYGPFSSCFNALLFYLFGPGLSVLFIANALWLTAAVGLMYWIIRRFASPGAASGGLVVFLLLLAFGQYSWIGGNNWILPYSHELTHGVTLALASLAAMLMAASRLDAGDQLPSASQSRWWLLAGLCTGLAFLTKPEPLIASLAGQGVVMIGLLHKDRRRWPGLLWWIGGLLLPVIVSTALLAMHMPIRQAMLGVIGSWQFVASEVNASHKFHRELMGMHEPASRLWRMTIWLAGYAAVLLPAAWLGWRLKRHGRWLAVVILIAGLILGWLAYDHRWIPWAGCLFPLPVVMVSGIAAAIMGRRQRSLPATLAMAGLAILSLVLMGRIILNVNVAYYGPFMAAPALVLGVVMVGGLWPERIRQAGGSPWPLRAAVTVILATLLGSHLATIHYFQQKQQIPVGTGRDRLQAAMPRGEFVRMVMDYWHRHAGPDDTLLVMPEGVMINYQLRVPSGARYVNFMPMEFAIYGDEAIVQELQRARPTFIVLVQKDTSEYGPARFGLDYGQQVIQWMKDHYQPMAMVGDHPMNHQGFGILIARRRTDQ